MGKRKRILKENLDVYDPYFQKLEDEWRYSLQTYSAHELMQIFPEAKKEIRILLRRRRMIYFILRRRIKSRLKKIKKSKSLFFQWFAREWIKYSKIRKLTKIGSEIKRLSLLLRAHHVPNKQFSTKESAETVSILDVAQQYIPHLRKEGRRYKAQCIFHDDRNPSLVFFPDTNSFYCFGCKKGGSVITFVQCINNCSFKKAVEILNNIYG